MPATEFPVAQTVRQRYSCRAYAPTPLSETERRGMAELLAAASGPSGTPLRFRLQAAEPGDASALRGLGTYGFIRGATAYVIGVAGPGPYALEDFGHALERITLGATALGLGSCWLGGSFSRSRFARAIEVRPEETLPAVLALGHPASGAEAGWMRKAVAGNARLPWNELFFDGDFGTPLAKDRAGAFEAPLEALRLAPSASNKQPWRVVREGDRYHLFLRRTPGYNGGLMKLLLKIADLQRVDMGIAMSHFELQAKESGLSGRWERQQPAFSIPVGTEYSCSWVAA